MTIGKHTAESTQEKKTRSWCFVFLVLCAFCCFSPAVSWGYAVYSKAAVVIDASTGELLYAKNPDMRCQPASTTKLITAVLAIEHLSSHAVVTVSKKASEVSPHKAGFRAGEQVTVEELLYAALLGSANDAAVALAEAVAGSEEKFVDLMNKKVVQIGASNTRFINSHGLPGTGQYTTATDLSRIMQHALQYPKLKQIINTRMAEISTERGRSIPLRNTNKLLWTEEGLIGGKTGYTRTAKHCFVGAAEREHDAVVVALLGSPSRGDLWRESELLIGKGFDVLNNGGEPAIYLSKTNELPVGEYKAKNNKRVKKKTKQAKKGTAFAAEKSGKKKKAVYAKKKSKAREIAKHKGKGKKFRVAKKGNGAKYKG